MNHAQLEPMLPRPYRVQRARKETIDTFTLELAPRESGSNHSFKAGQFNMLYVFGVGEIPISISSDPGQTDKIEHTTRMVGAVTSAMRKLKPGDTIGVRGPFGSHWPVELAQGRDLVIVAGGIGLAPLRPAIHQILSNRDQYGRVVLLYGARTPQDMLYRRDLQRWRRQFDMDVHVTVDRATGDWRGNVGVVSALIPRAPFNPANAVAFLCGPEIMMRFTVMELQTRGIAPASIFISMERNMKCGIGFCGHCQFGPAFVCKDGPVFCVDQVQPLLGKPEI